MAPILAWYDVIKDIAPYLRQPGEDRQLSACKETPDKRNVYVVLSALLRKTLTKQAEALLEGFAKLHPERDKKELIGGIIHELRDELFHSMFEPPPRVRSINWLLSLAPTYGKYDLGNINATISFLELAKVDPKELCPGETSAIKSTRKICRKMCERYIDLEINPACTGEVTIPESYLSGKEQIGKLLQRLRVARTRKLLQARINAAKQTPQARNV